VAIAIEKLREEKATHFYGVAELNVLIQIYRGFF